MAEPGVRIAAAAGQPIMGMDSSGNAQHFQVAPGGGMMLESTAGEYETVAASQTDQVMGTTGAVGDFLASVLIIPASTSPGAVQIKDGSGSAVTIFAGGASSVASLTPFSVPLNLRSAAGAWKITTGAAVSAIGSGNFT